MAATEQERSLLLETPAGQEELILVVDDEATIREITKTSLETYNYKVLIASDNNPTSATQNNLLSPSTI